MTDTRDLTNMTAKAEYCAACGKPLGMMRYLVLDPNRSGYVAIHHQDRCLEMFRDQHEPPLGSSSTAGASWVW